MSTLKVKGMEDEHSYGGKGLAGKDGNKVEEEEVSITDMKDKMANDHSYADRQQKGEDSTHRGVGEETTKEDQRTGGGVREDSNVRGGVSIDSDEVKVLGKALNRGRGSNRLVWTTENEERYRGGRHMDHHRTVTT